MNLKQTALSAAVAATMALASGQAAAYVYAASALDVSNFTVVATNATITSFQERATNTATLNGADATTGTGGTGAGAGKLSQSCSGLPGVPSGTTNNCNPAPPRVDPGAANAPGGTPIRNNNDFSLFGTATEYSNSDSVIQTSQLTLDPTTSTRQIAESNLTTGSGANANSEITSTTGFNIVFTVGANGSITIDFLADPYLRAAIGGANFLAAAATPNLAVHATLTQIATNQTLTFNPDGTLNSCSHSGAVAFATCTENLDPFSLNTSIPDTAFPTDITINNPNGEFSVTFSGLTAGQYSLNLDALTSTDVSQLLATTVPEPGILALLGMGLVGAFATTRRRGKTA